MDVFSLKTHLSRTYCKAYCQRSRHGSYNDIGIIIVEFPITRVTVRFKYMHIKSSRLYHIESFMDDLFLKDSSFIFHLQTHINVKKTDIGSTITLENSDWNVDLQWKHMYLMMYFNLVRDLMNHLLYQYCNQVIIDELIVKRDE